MASLVHATVPSMPGKVHVRIHLKQAPLKQNVTGRNFLCEGYGNVFRFRG